MPSLLVTLLFLAPAQADTDSPQGQPPLIATVRAVGDRLVSKKTVTESIPVTVTKQVEKNGMKVDVTVTELRTQSKQVEQTWTLTGATITDASGKKITLEAAKKQLASETPVLISTNFQPVDKAYLKLFKKDILVVVPAAPKAVVPLPKVEEKK